MMILRWNDWSDRCNPVFVKELRGLTRRTIWWLFFLVLLIELCFLGYRLNYNLEFFNFSIYAWMCYVGAFLFSFAARSNKERLSADLDFARVTALPPRKIIRGKFTASLLVGGLFWLSYSVVIVTVLVTGHDGCSLRYMLSIWGTYGLFLLLLVMQSILLGACTGRLVFLLLLVLIGLFDFRLPEFFYGGHVISVVLLSGILLWITVFWGLLAEAALGDVNTYRIAPLRKFLVVSVVLGFVFCDACSRFEFNYRPQNYWFDYFCWWTDFAALLMWLAMTEPTLPGRRALAAAAADSTLKYWCNRLLSESAVSGFLLGLLLSAVGVGGVLLTAGQVIWERNVAINGAALTIFGVGLLIGAKRWFEGIWNTHSFSLNVMPLLGFFVSVKALSLLLCISKGSLPFPLRDNLGAFHLDRWGADQLSPLFAGVMTLLGISFVLPSTVAYFRLKKE